MKTLIHRLILFLVLAVSAAAQIQLNTVKVPQVFNIPGGNPQWIDRYVNPTTAGLFGFGTDKVPVYLTLGTNLSISGTTLNASGGSGLPDQTGNAGKYLTTNGTAASWASLAGGGNVNAGGTLTLHAVVLGAGSTSVSALGSLGTSTTVLHGNASGDPTFGAVAIGSDVSGLGTGVATALAVNVGSAGAPVVLNGAGGTPSSINLQNGTALPVAGITSSTSTALGVGSLELGNASDTTLSRSSAGVLAVEGVVIPSISSTNTLTNKTISGASNTLTVRLANDITGFGTGIATALAVNTGSAGAPVLFNGAGGTPSSINLGSGTALPDGGLTLTDVTTNNVSTSKHGFAPKSDGNAAHYLDGTGNYSTPAGSGTGTVTVVGGGSLTSTALVTGGGAQALQTPAATATMDSSGNISTPGTITTGAGGSTAGALVLGQGTAPSAGTTNITLYAPASVTSYVRVLSGSAATGFYLGTNSGGTVTDTQVAANGSGNVLLSAGTAAITSGKTLTVSNSLTLAGTDSTTMTFPSTSATIARTDAANTFTGASTASAWVLTSPTITTKISPTSDDGAPLGDTTHNFSDLFLASGAVINFANSNYTMTHSSGLLTASGPLSLGTSNAFTTGTIELGAASDTTLSRVAAGQIAVEGVNVVTTSSTDTLTNKRVTARVGTTTSSATPTINTDNVDIYSLTAQTADITSFTTNLSGTPVNGDQLEIRVTGTAARAITWGTGFVAGPAALPTTTVTTKTLYVYFEYDSVVTHWVCMFSGSLP